MPFLDKLRGLLGPPKTGRYQPFPRHHYFRSFRKLDPFTFEHVAEMIYDPTLKLGLAMRAAPLMQVQFAYKQGEAWVEGIKADRPEVGDYIHRQLQRIWKFDIHKLLTSQTWGWSAGEVTYRQVGRQVHIDRILHRMPWDTQALLDASNGSVGGVRFQNIPGKGFVDLRFPECIWHSFFPAGELPYGVPILRGAYDAWSDKYLEGGALDVRRLFCHKYAFGGESIGYPPGNTRIDGAGSDPVPNRDIAKEMVEQRRAGNVMTRPNTFDSRGNPKWVIDPPSWPGNVDHILRFPQDLDSEMLRGLEIPDDVIAAEASGAWQGKQVPMQAFYTAADLWLAELIEAIVTQVLERLVWWNWGKAEDFEVQTKPLAEQALEQIKADNDLEGDGPTEGMQPSHRLSRDATDAERLVGAGVLEAAQLARSLIELRRNGNGRSVFGVRGGTP